MHSVFTTISWDPYYHYYLHFTDEETNPNLNSVLTSQPKPLNLTCTSSRAEAMPFLTQPYCLVHENSYPLLAKGPLWNSNGSYVRLHQERKNNLARDLHEGHPACPIVSKKLRGSGDEAAPYRASLPVRHQQPSIMSPEEEWPNATDAEEDIKRESKPQVLLVRPGWDSRDISRTS